jgi:peptidyl-prolyl cis-trans isomerase C
MRRSTIPALAAAMLLSVPATPLLAQTAAPTAPAAASSAAPPAAPGADPVVAKVGTDEIHASDLADAAQNLPEELRGMPPQMLYPMLLDQMIDRRAIVIEGRKEGLQNDPAVKKQVERATDTAVQNLLLTRAITPLLTDEAIKARYDKEYAGKPGDEEVHAEHILVADEAKAKEIIAQLKAGKDFADLAKANSTDPSAKTNNGDLGFFKKADMLPEFSAAAFALKPGEYTQTPVKTRFGWHVIKLLERRTAPPPELDAVKDEIRQQIIQEGVAKVLASAKQGLVVQKFNQDGTPMTDAAAATPAPGTTPAPAPAPAK